MKNDVVSYEKNGKNYLEINNNKYETTELIDASSVEFHRQHGGETVAIYKHTPLFCFTVDNGEDLSDKFFALIDTDKRGEKIEYSDYYRGILASGQVVVFDSDEERDSYCARNINSCAITKDQAKSILGRNYYFRSDNVISRKLRGTCETVKVFNCRANAYELGMCKDVRPEDCGPDTEK
jgi:hypothetical protein